MPIEDLLELVDTLRRRIDEHRVALGKSEALTRYSLIDPLLRGLGWDTDDPALVIPEYREPSTNRKPDYVLLNKGNPFIVVEAKKLGENLRDTKVIQQALNDCSFTESQFFSLTDGRLWDLYDLGRIVPKISFDLKEGSAAEVCLKAMALWKPSAVSGSMAAAQTPVVGLPTDTPAITIPQPAPVVDTTTSSTVSPPSVEQVWHRLTRLREVEIKRDEKPLELITPTDIRIEVSNWADSLRKLFCWLIDIGKLDESNCPIKFDTSRTRYLVNTEAVHSDGRDFTQRFEYRGFYLEQDNGSYSALVRTMLKIIQHVGQDPAQFKVRVS